MNGMTGREAVARLLSAMNDTDLRRMRAIAERRCLERPDDEKSANLHALIVDETRRRQPRKDAA